jgi:membrane protein implicated in regulation of membrane protease activity
VVEAFRNGRGEVEIDDTRWRAEATDGSDIAQGAHVTIQSVDGILLKVAAAS